MDNSEKIKALKEEAEALREPIRQAQATLDALGEKRYSLQREIASLRGWKRGAVVIAGHNERGVITNVTGVHPHDDGSYDIDWRAFKQDGTLGKQHRRDYHGARLTGAFYEGEL